MKEDPVLEVHYTYTSEEIIDLTCASFLREGHQRIYRGIVPFVQVTREVLGNERLTGAVQVFQFLLSRESVPRV